MFLFHLVYCKRVKFISACHLWQYFLPFATEGINKHIEQAILRADRLGVKVISLAALNKVGTCFILIYVLKC